MKKNNEIRRTMTTEPEQIIRTLEQIAQDILTRR